MSFIPFPNNKNFSDNNQDPDVNFFLDNISSLNTEYFSPYYVKTGFLKFEYPVIFLILHLNIRSLRKNLEDFKEFYKTINLKQSIIYFQKKESKWWRDKYICSQVAVLQVTRRFGHKFASSGIC